MLKPKNFEHGLELIRGNHAKIDFSNLGVTLERLEDLVSALLEQDSVTCLSLRGNKISDKGMKILSRYFENTRALEEIDLGKNMIGCNGLHDLIMKLKKSSSKLNKLNVAYNHIRNTGGELLAKYLETEKSCLTYVKCDGNYLTDFVVPYFTKSAEKNLNLILLTINCGTIQDEKLLEPLERFLQRNNELKRENEKEKQKLLRIISKTYDTKAPVKRSMLHVLGSSSSGKSSLVQNVMKSKISLKKNQDIAATITKVCVQPKGWTKDTSFNTFSIQMALRIVSAEDEVLKQKFLIENEKKRHQNLMKKKEEEQKRLKKEDEIVEEFKKNPAKFKKLPPSQKREVREIMKRVKQRNSKLNHEKASLFKRLSPKDKKQVREEKRRELKESKDLLPLLSPEKIEHLVNNVENLRNAVKELPQLSLQVVEYNADKRFAPLQHVLLSNTTKGLFVLCFDIRNLEKDVDQLVHFVTMLLLHQNDEDEDGFRMMFVATFMDEFEMLMFERDQDSLKELARLGFFLEKVLKEKEKDLEKKVVWNAKDSLIFFPCDNINGNGSLEIRRTLEKVFEEQKQVVDLSVPLKWLSILDELNTYRAPTREEEKKEEVEEQVVQVQEEDAMDEIVQVAEANLQNARAMEQALERQQPLVPAKNLRELARRMRKNRFTKFKGFVPLSQVHRTCSQFGLNDMKEISDMLTFFHQMGIIFYISSCQVVVLDITWFLNALSKIGKDSFTLEQKEDIAARNLQNQLDIFVSTGIASLDLLELYLEDESSDSIKFLIDFLTKTFQISKGSQDTFLFPSFFKDSPSTSSFGMKFRINFEVGCEQTMFFERLFCLFNAISIPEGLNDRKLEKQCCEFLLNNKSRVLLVQQGGLFTVGFNEEQCAAENLNMFSKMVAKLEHDLGVKSGKLKRKILIMTEKGKIKLEAVKEQKLLPWWSPEKTAKAEEGVDLGSFLDTV